MNYEDQLKTVEWKLKAIEIKNRDNNECQICGNKEMLHVHHVVYEYHLLAWQYPDNYYITLCPVCHLYEHSFIDDKLEKLKKMLLSGMMGIDIYKKHKSKEVFDDGIPF